MYALVDCNSFYVSCERLFRPDLKHKPVVVLSNNDGCIVSRSAEAKQLGIKMAVPYFEVRQHAERGHLHVFSSNYALYGDISERVMTTLESMVPEVEIYSIDEAFLDLSEMKALTDLNQFGHAIKTRIDDWVGVPVSVGIGPTKTLAKLANHAAKRYPQTQGVVVLDNERWRTRLLNVTDVGEVWGVGRRLAERLHAENIKLAADLANSDPDSISKRYSVLLARTVLELQGTPCIEFQQQPEPKQHIQCTRSFSHRVTDFQRLSEAINEYAARAAEKLRQEAQVAQSISIYIRTNPKEGFAQRYANRAQYTLPSPTSDTRLIVHTAVQLLKHIFKDGYRYMKAGVTLSELQPQGSYQTDLFCADFNSSTSQRLMHTVDKINVRYNRGVFLAGQGIQQSWAMNRQYLSPSYTTNWKSLRRVK